MKRARTNQLARQRNRKYYAKARKAGWCKSSAWIHETAAEEIRRQSTRLVVHKESIIRAAIVIGLRRLTTSDIQAVDRKWHETINLPMPMLVKSGQYRAVRNPETHKFTGYEPVTKSA